MATRIDGKFYKLDVYEGYGDFLLELVNVNNSEDRITIGIGRLQDYQIEERIEEDLKDSLKEHYPELVDKLCYLRSENEKEGYVKSVAEQMTEDYITDFIEISLSNRIHKEIVKEAEAWFKDRANGVWETILDETEKEHRERLNKLDLEYNELETLESLKEHCIEQIDVLTMQANWYEREQWKRRRESIETMLERVI